MEHWRLCEKLLRDSVIPVKTLQLVSVLSISPEVLGHFNQIMNMP